MGDLYSVLSKLSLSGRAMLQCQMEVEPREVKNMKIKRLRSCSISPVLGLVCLDLDVLG